MELTLRPCNTEEDFFRARNFLRKVFLLNDRLKHLGCTRVFATANEEPADALYKSVMTDMKVTDTWVKEWS